MGWLGIAGGLFGVLLLTADLFNLLPGEGPTLATWILVLAIFAFQLILGVRLLAWRTRSVTASLPLRSRSG